MKRLIIFLAVLGFLGVVAGGAFVTWGYYYVTRDLPKLESVDDFSPAAVSSVQAADGTLIAEFFEERRYPVKINEIPPFLRNAFVAAEDASFYSHPGIDVVSIFRAMIKNLLAGTMKQGGSTITQQVVKNLLLTSEKKVTRKIKEAILSYRLEKRLSKDDILEIYLNQIFFGNRSYGIKSAVHNYFHKELSQVTLAEAAMLAGLPKAPSRYSPLTNYPEARRRQLYVLGQMVEAGFVSAEAAKAAEGEKVEVFPAVESNILAAPYFVSEVRRDLQTRFKNLRPDVDGLKIVTTLDLRAENALEKGLREGVLTADKRQGWRGPLEQLTGDARAAYLEKYAARLNEYSKLISGENFPAVVTLVDQARHLFKALLGSDLHEVSIDIKPKSWAWNFKTGRDDNRYLDPLSKLVPGSVVELVRSNEQNNWELSQSPALEGASVIIDPFSGRVLALVGGFDFAKSQFNRVTQSLRQPGSSFKPILYLAAVDGFQYTPATIVSDAPRTFRVGEDYWAPGNFDKNFLGNITLRTALERSRNLVSADIASRIGVDAIISYARKLGIESALGRNLSISLGSSEVNLLELTKAYGVFPARGMVMTPTLISAIYDRKGNLIYDEQADRAARGVQAVRSSSAFVMANMMQGVIQNGTAQRLKVFGRPAGGKTGTSNDHMDAWFIGFTPNLLCGVWVGYDVKVNMGKDETGGRVAAPIWLSAMSEYVTALEAEARQRQLADAKIEAERLGVEYVEPPVLPPAQFEVPDGVEPFWVDRTTGIQVEQGAENSVLDYFISGTQPNPPPDSSTGTSQYLSSPDL